MSKKLISLLLILMGTLPTHVLLAKENEDNFPTECKTAGYHFKMKTVELAPDQSTQKQAMYFFHNTGSEDLQLYQMRGKDSSRSLYLNHTIHPNQWAVLATSEKVTRYICTHPAPKLTQGKIVDCADSVKICQFTHVRFGMNNKGNYWIVDNTDKNSALRGIVHYGIIP
ncbi:MAG: endopeptidase IV [Gammaproteobacteria bacterium]|nr:endopeptidase IV [Gammaproteobacteria bacterium]